jgi:hypothetical protein
MGELQRQRSNGGWASSSQRKGRINFLRGNKNRRGFSLTKKTVKVLYLLLIQMKNVGYQRAEVGTV